MGDIYNIKFGNNISVVTRSGRRNRNRSFVFTTLISIMQRLPGQQKCVRNLI